MVADIDTATIRRWFYLSDPYKQTPRSMQGYMADLCDEVDRLRACLAEVEDQRDRLAAEIVTISGERGERGHFDARAADLYQARAEAAEARVSEVEAEREHNLGLYTLALDGNARLIARAEAAEAEAFEHREARQELNDRCTDYRLRAEVAEARLAEVEPVVAAGKAWVSALDSMAPNEGVHPYALALVDAIRAAARGEGDRPATDAINESKPHGEGDRG